MSRSANYWQEVVIQAFRIPIRLALRFSHPSLKDLQNLMRTAAVRELEEQGNSVREMSVLLDVSDTWIRKLRRRSKEIGGLADDDAFLSRLVDHLRKGPATEAELEAIAPYGADFPVERVALLVLERGGIVCGPSTPGGKWSLQGDFQARSEGSWRQPLRGLDQVYLAAMDLLLELRSGSPLSLERAMANQTLASHGRECLLQALSLLEEWGLLGQDPTDPPQWRPKAEMLRLIPKDPERRVRTGVMLMLSHLGQGLESILAQAPDSPFGQRTLLFQATPEGLRRFVAEHRNETLAKLKEVDEAAEASPEGRAAQMIWLITGGWTSHGTGA